MLTVAGLMALAPFTRLGAKLGQIEQAKSYLQQALTIFERINSPSAELVRDWLDELEEE